MYQTDLTNILGTVRFYPMGHQSFTPYVKLYGGMALIGTDLRFMNAEDQINIYDPLYSRGTSLSVIEPKKYSSPHFGAGLGFEYGITGNISLMADLNFSYINTDIVNGVPNFTYDSNLGYSVYKEIPTITSQLSIGVCYTLGDVAGKGGSFKGGKKSGSGSTSTSLPFYRKK